MAELVDVDPGSLEWLEVRRSGITATDIPVILGLSPWDSKFALWHRKAGNHEPRYRRSRWPCDSDRDHCHV